IPIPEIYGILQEKDSKRRFLFMSRAPGEPLDSRWDSLDKAQKPSVQMQLDSMMRDLRSIRLPPSMDGDAVLGNGKPRRCKDARTQMRVASEPVSDEHGFNRFLTFNPQRSETCTIGMIRSHLETDHKSMMTHGDLHPRNIMVALNPQADSPDSSVSKVSITALLDWEMCGLYPEYWEYVKALHTISPGTGCDDWWAYLPHSIGVWPREHAVDLMLSRWHG
ncbi:hypothetical protein P170DRAFT_348993, partial [Aspergillus steynii IBT 23096]